MEGSCCQQLYRQLATFFGLRLTARPCHPMATPPPPLNKGVSSTPDLAVILIKVDILLIPEEK